MRIGIDLGGSHVAVAIINENNELIGKLEENFNEEEKKTIETSIIEKITINTEKLLSQKGLTLSDITNIGIACPRNHSRWRNCKVSEI